MLCKVIKLILSQTRRAMHSTLPHNLSESRKGGAPPHSWFIGFATMSDDRTVAMEVYAEAAGDGSAVAAPIAGYILENVIPYSQ